MERDFEALLASFLERWTEDGNIALQGVTTEIDANDALGAVLESEVDDFESRRGVVAAVDGEDEVCFQGCGGPVESVDTGEDEVDVVIFGDVFGRDGSWCGPKFDVDEAVCFKVFENGICGVDY